MDTISNMLISIKNAVAVKKERITVPYSKVALEIAKILKQEGFITDCKRKDKKIEIQLKYKGESPYITDIKRISRPGCRIYSKNKQIPVVLHGFGIVIVSTPQGIMTGQEAKKKGLGGELICKVW